MNNMATSLAMDYEVDTTYYPEEILTLSRKSEREFRAIIDQELKKNWFIKNWKYIVGIVITLGLMIFLIWKSNPLSIWETLIKSNYFMILASFGVTVILFSIKTFRWKFILKNQGINLPFFQILDLVLIGAFGSSITPAKVGDILRAVYLVKRNENAKTGNAVFSVIFDRILDFIGIFIIIGITSPFILLKFDNIGWQIPFGITIGFILFVILTIAIFSEKITKPILCFVIKFFSKAFRKQENKNKINFSSNEIINDFFASQKKYKIKNYLFFGLLSILFWFALGLQGSLLLEAFGIDNANPLVVISVLCIAAIVATTIPTSIAGIGIRDFVIITLLYLILGIKEAPAISLSMIQTFLNVIIPGLIGGLLTLRTKKTKDQPEAKLIAIS